MKFINKYLFLIIVTLLACNQKNNVLTNIEKITKIDTTKKVMIIVYKPLECLSCNACVHNIYDDSIIQSKFGENIFICYNGIREIELNDYSNNLEETILVKPKMINNAEIYNQLITESGINTMSLKPTCFVLTKKSKQIKVVDLKSPEILEQLVSD